MMDKTRVFISHSHLDNDFAVKLAEDIEETGMNCWIDLWELQVGDSLRKKVEQGINTSDWLIIILSRNSINSNWVQHELDMGITKELDSKDVFVLPVLMDNCEIPLCLKTKVYANFISNYNNGLDAIISRLTNLTPEERRIKRKFNKYCFTCDEQIPLFASCFAFAIQSGIPIPSILNMLEGSMPEPFSNLVSILKSKIEKRYSMKFAMGEIRKLLPTKRMELLYLYVSIAEDCGSYELLRSANFQTYQSGILLNS